MKPKTQKIASAVVGVVGLALLAMMITVESEPGALPLALLLLAGIGYAGGRWREKSAARKRSAT